jgi:hypothetical protein
LADSTPHCGTMGASRGCFQCRPHDLTEMNLAGSWQSQAGCNPIQKTVEGHEKSFRFAFGIAIQHTNKPRLFHEVAFWGVVKSLVSPFVSKVSNSPSAISLAATAVIDPSSKAFLQLRLPSPSFINSTKSPEIRFSAALMFHSITEYCKFRMDLPV